MLKDFAQFHTYCFLCKVNDKVCPTCASEKKVYEKVYQKMGRNNLSLLILRKMTIKLCKNLRSGAKSTKNM